LGRLAAWSRTQAHVQGSLPAPRLSRLAAAGSALTIPRRCGRNHRLRFRAAARSWRTWALATPARGGKLARRGWPRREPRAVRLGDLLYGRRRAPSAKSAYRLRPTAPRQADGNWGPAVRRLRWAGSRLTGDNISVATLGRHAGFWRPRRRETWRASSSPLRTRRPYFPLLRYPPPRIVRFVRSSRLCGLWCSDQLASLVGRAR